MIGLSFFRGAWFWMNLPEEARVQVRAVWPGAPAMMPSKSSG